jgi:bacteriorhodopsin
MDLAFNTVAFGSVLGKEILYDDKPGMMDVQKASAAILGIAFTQYAITTAIHRSNPTVAQELRYIDWVATTPLLLYTYWAVAKRDGWDHAFLPLAVAVVTMIVMGYVAEVTDNKYVFAASMLPYLFILYEIRGMQALLKGKGKENAARLGHFFTAGWAVYPIAFYLPDSQKYLLYSIADFFNKAVYSVYLQAVL